MRHATLLMTIAALLSCATNTSAVTLGQIPPVLSLVAHEADALAAVWADKPGPECVVFEVAASTLYVASTAMLDSLDATTDVTLPAVQTDVTACVGWHAHGRITPELVDMIPAALTGLMGAAEVSLTNMEAHDQCVARAWLNAAQHAATLHREILDELEQPDGQLSVPQTTVRLSECH